MTLTFSTSRNNKDGMTPGTKYSTGFSLVELLVSMGIMLVILTVVLSNQSKYTEGAALTGLADDISLDLSQAQIYGVSVREFSPGSDEFDAAYGLSFNRVVQGGDSSYIYFADRGSKNTAYDSGWDCPLDAGSECIKKTSVSRGNTISAICAIPDSEVEFCEIGRVDVTYLRPITDANLTFFDQGGNLLILSGIKGVKIEVSSPSGASRSVYVYKAGQISVQ